MSSTSPHKPSEYHKMIAEALDDEFLRRTLDKFAVDYRASRDKVFTEVDGADLIRRIADRKDWCARHLEELYEQFKTEDGKAASSWAADYQWFGGNYQNNDSAKSSYFEIIDYVKAA